jgi:predicted Zn-dependent peptidase
VQHLVKINDVTAEDVQETAQRYLQKDAHSMVLVGDAEEIGKTVRQFGKVEV